MMDQGTRAALADLGTPWVGRQVPPPKTISLGKTTTSRGRSGGTESRGRSESAKLDETSGEGELGRASGDEGELGGTSLDEGELGGTSGD